jgi:two-component system invasion response regulator UvrY
MVDDHELVRTGIKKMLADIQGLEVIAEAESSKEAVRLARITRPDVVLLDVKMPGIRGLEATHKLLRFNPDIKILVVTLYDNFFSERLLKAGASGYLTKDASMDEMVQAIRAVHIGERYMSPTIVNQLAFKYISGDESPIEVLSDSELETLMLLVSGFKIQEISEKLNLASKTITARRSQILKKLGVESDVELLLLAIRCGLIVVVNNKARSHDAPAKQIV